MRVIEITGEPLQHGGQEQFLTYLFENMDFEGFRIDVLTPYTSENGTFEALVRSKGGDVFALNQPFEPGKSRRKLLKPITRFLREGKYDAVHVHSGSVSVLAYVSLAARRAGISKVIVHSHSTGYPSLKHRVIRFLFGFMLTRNATDFLACSRAAGEVKFPRRVVQERLVVIRNGISIGDFACSQAGREAGREKLAIPQDALVLGHIGRFSREKNHRFLIDLFQEVHRLMPRSLLLLVGDGELFDNVRQQAEDLGLSAFIRFTGSVDRTAEYYQVMDIFLMPSLYEGLSYVTLEAQAAGIPCLISPGIPEEAVVAENVRRISLEDLQGWIKGIREMAGMPPTDNGEMLRKAGYDVRETARHIREIYLRE